MEGDHFLLPFLVQEGYNNLLGGGGQYLAANFGPGGLLFAANFGLGDHFGDQILRDRPPCH
jgi:hypothetical protein